MPPADKIDEDLRHRLRSPQPPAALAANLRWLSGYRHWRSGDEQLEGLSHTWGEGRDLSPNDMYAACVGIRGHVPLPLTGDDYIELLPAMFRTVV